jgi:hypothetical protein
MAESSVNSQPLVRPSPLYLAQAKAFLSYIEDVEADEETIEDIIIDIDEFYLSVTSDGEESGAEPDTPHNDDAENDPDGDEDEFAQEGEVYFDANRLWEVLIWWFGFSR